MAKEVFVADSSLHPWARSYDPFLIATGYSLPGATVTRWRDAVRGGEWFRVEAAS
jgi:hypothetical protein